MTTIKVTLSKVVCLGLLLFFNGQIQPSYAKPVGASGASPVITQDGSSSQLRASYSLRKTNVGPSALQARGAATTSLAGLFRFTCEADSGFLPQQCRADLFGSCSANGPRIALTTDNFLSLRADIDNAQDGDKWTWNWQPPNATLTFPATLVFHEVFNGEQQCFEFSTPFGIHGFVCGGRSISFEWGSGAVHGGAEGLWFVDLSLNDQLLFHEPFELFQPPQVTFKGYSAQLLASGVLDVNVELVVSARDPGAHPSNVQVLASTNPPVAGSVDYNLQPGANTLQVNLAQLGIGPFDDDVTLQIRRATPTGCSSVPPQQSFASLKIPLPVFFVHGYVEGSLKFPLFSGSTATIIRNLQGEGLFDYLIALSTPEPNTVVSRIPYERSDGVYPTLSMFDWVSIADSPVEIITQRLRTHITERLNATYATRVNLLTHSLGGFIGRIAVADGVPIRKLIMVGSPNNRTSYVWQRSSGYSREDINRLASRLIGYALPRTDVPPFSTRGPYEKGNACSTLSIPVQRLSLPPLSSDPQLKIFNIFTNNLGTDDTPWDLIAVFDKKRNWYDFTRRQLQVAQGCDPSTPLPAYRSGDGAVSVQDAALGVDYDIRIETNEKIKGAGVPHLFQLGNNLVRREIARSLGVIQ